MVLLRPSKHQGGGENSAILNPVLFQTLGPSAFQNCIPLTNINRYERKGFKKKKNPHTPKQPVRRNEGVVLVTYGTMSRSGLPVSGARVTDHSWPSGRQQSTAQGGGDRDRAGRGPSLLSGSLHKKAAQLLSGAFLLSISQPLCMCPAVFSSAGNCPDGQTLNSHSLGKSETLLSDHHSKSASRWWVKFSKGSVLLIVPESLSAPPPAPALAGRHTHSPRGRNALWQ